jgi:hypothetical protein
MEKASPMSIMKAGIGRKKMQRIEMMPSAKPMSRLLFFIGRTEAIAACCAMVHLAVVGHNMAAQACVKLPAARPWRSTWRSAFFWRANVGAGTISFAANFSEGLAH